jgi:hypothetical protein
MSGLLRCWDKPSQSSNPDPLPLEGVGIVVVRTETENRYTWFTGFVSSSNVRFDTRIEKIDIFTDPLLASFSTENIVDP